MPTYEGYGSNWTFPEGTSLEQALLHIEFECYKRSFGKKERWKEAADHFRNIVRMLWSDPSTGVSTYVWMSDDPDIPYESQWNDRMLEACLKCNWCAISGPSSAGKSTFFAIWALVNWICRFHECAVVVTSTTIKGAKTRVWGLLKEYYNRIHPDFRPGRLVDSMNIILANDGSKETKGFSERSAITLIAPGGKREGEELGKIVGLHNKYVFVIGDEFGDMTPAIANACENLRDNHNFHAAWLFNFNKTYDPFGKQCTPKSGNWEDVSVDDLFWDTRNDRGVEGICLHLNGEKTPNRYSNPPDKYTYLQKWSEIQLRQAAGQATSAGYYRFVLSYPMPQGNQDALYSDLELAKNDAFKQATWLGGTTQLAALDPAYVEDSDDFVSGFASLGSDNRAKQILQFDEIEPIYEDVTQKTKTIREYVAEKFVAECKKRQIGVRQIAIDCTGGGGYFADEVERLFGERGVLRVIFSEKPSELPVSQQDSRKSNEVYFNKNSELWCCGVNYVLSGQLRGVKAKQAEEMCERRSFEKNRKIHIETKKEYKRRTGKESPGYGDAGFLLLELARQRFNFAVGLDGIPKASSDSLDWEDAFHRYTPEENDGPTVFT